MTTVTILTTIFEDKSRAYEIAINDDRRDSVVQFDVDSFEGAEEIAAVIAANSSDSIKVMHDRRVY